MNPSWPGLAETRTNDVINRASHGLQVTAAEKQSGGDIYTQAARYTPQLDYRKCLIAAAKLDEYALGQLLDATADPADFKTNHELYHLSYSGEAAETHRAVLTNLLILFGDEAFSKNLRFKDPKAVVLVRSLLTETSPQDLASAKQNYPKSLN